MCVRERERVFCVCACVCVCVCVCVCCVCVVLCVLLARPGGCVFRLNTRCVPADAQEATVEQLKLAINEKFGMPIVCQRLVRPTQHGGIVLGSDAAQLKRDCGVWFGDEVIVELVAEEGRAAPSACKAALDAQRSQITVSFNAVATPAEFDHVVVASKLDSVAALKASIAAALGCEAGIIHLRRNGRAPQLKDESVTVGSLDMVEGSVVFVGAGAPMRPNEVLIKVREGSRWWVRIGVFPDV